MVRRWGKCGVLGSCLYSACLFPHLLLFGNPQAQLALSPPGLGVSLGWGHSSDSVVCVPFCELDGVPGGRNQVVLPPLISARYPAALSWWEGRENVLGSHTPPLIGILPNPIPGNGLLWGFGQGDSTARLLGSGESRLIPRSRERSSGV